MVGGWKGIEKKNGTVRKVASPQFMATFSPLCPALPSTLSPTQLESLLEQTDCGLTGQ